MACECPTMEESTRSGCTSFSYNPPAMLIDRLPDGRPDAIQALGAIVLSHEGGHVGRRLLQQRHGVQNNPITAIAAPRASVEKFPRKTRSIVSCRFQKLLAMMRPRDLENGTPTLPAGINRCVWGRKRWFQRCLRTFIQVDNLYPQNPNRIAKRPEQVWTAAPSARLFPCAAPA